MRSKLLIIGIVLMLVMGTLLTGCPEKASPPPESPETTPAPTPGQDSTLPGTEPEPAPKSAKDKSTQEQPKSTRTSLPEPVQAPPRPDTAFVTERQDVILLEDDFNDGNAFGWELETGWDVSLDSNNYVLSGKDHCFARPDVSDWTDYTVEARFKLVRGSFHFNLRENSYAGLVRYFVGVHSGSITLSRQIAEDFFDLSQSSVSISFNQWYSLRAVVDGNNIKVYIDDNLRLNYTDSDIPISSGIISLETLDNSLAHFDDLTVTGTRIVQRASWLKTGGPSGGLGYDVRIHPLDKKIMFVTDNPSGVNKSYNAGDTWVQRNDGITARTGTSGDGIPIFSLTIDPGNPDIVWAGTQTMRGIYKSTDGGETWTKKDDGIIEWNEITLRGFAIHPDNSDIVLAGAEITTGIMGPEFDKARGKIYKTEDGGENWRCVWEGDSLARIIIFDPTNPDTLYASTGIFDRDAFNDAGEGVLKSSDGGETWRQINNGLENLFVGFLEMHPENPQILFAAVGNNTHREGLGIYRTVNSGESWEKVSSDGICSMTVVTMSPSNPEVVYAGGECSFFRSDDGGDTWHRFRRPEGNFGPPGVRAGFPISAVVDPDDPMTVFVNNYSGGVFKSTDGAQTWVDCSSGYTGADLHRIAVTSYNPDMVYVIGRSGPFRSLDGGQEWDGLAYSPAAFAEWDTIAINPENPLEILIADEFEGSLLRSNNGGESWAMAFQHPLTRDGRTENRHGFKAIVYAPSNPEIIYAGMRKGRRTIEGDFYVSSSYGVYKSTDGGRSWKEKNNGLDSDYLNINDIAVHPSNPDIAYIATWRDGIFKTTDGGENWATVNSGLLSLDVRSLVIDPDNPDTVYAGLAEGVGIFKTTNGGELWEPINMGIQVQCPSFLQRVGQVQPGVSLEIPQRTIGGEYYSIPWTNIASIAIDPVDPQILYAADSHLGVYMSMDGGANWTPINEGLSTKAVTSLALSADGWILYAATSGEGVFRLELW